MTNFFLEIVNMSITASYLIVAVVIFRLILNKAPKWIRGILWGLVGIRLVIPFSFESMFSLIPSGSPISTLNNYGTATGVDTGALPEMWDFNTGAGATPQSMDVVGSGAPAVEVSQTGDISFATILAVVWLVGIVLMIAYCVVSYVRLNKRVSDAVIYRGGKYAIYQSEKVVSPFVLGFFSPRIYLPFKMDAKDAECVIAHERAHIKRKDHWIKPLAFVILSVYWFNPLIWVAYILLCRDIELACDEKVIKEMGVQNKKAYSEALMKCGVPQRMISACPLAFGEVGVKKRIVNVLHYKKPAFWIILVSLILCAVVAVCFLTNPKEDTVPYINDGSVDWENVSEIVIYSDGYYGRTMEEPMVITDENMLKEIIDETLNSSEYKEVEDGEQLEGMGAIFIDYQNGTIISMYGEVNYGMISDTMQTTGAPCYYVPRELYDTVIELLEDSYNREMLINTGQFPYLDPNTQQNVNEVMYSPPTMTLQDSLSSTINFFNVESGTYSWSYSTGKPDEMATAEASGLFPTAAVKGQEWLQIRDYNGIDYAPYHASFVVAPDRIKIREYDLLDLGDTEPQILAETEMEEVYFLELRERRIYEVIAQWDEENLATNGFYGEATYIFATDNYAISGSVNQMEVQTMPGMNLPAVVDEPWEYEVNTLDGVELNMEKYSAIGGDLEIVNQLRKRLEGGQWFTIQREMDGQWYDLVVPGNIAYEDIAYILPAGETTILPITWEWIYGELPVGQYRVVTKVHDYRGPGDYDVYYLAEEFEIMKSY